MKPRPLTILLLLLAGAVVNVGVAWGTWLRHTATKTHVVYEGIAAAHLVFRELESTGPGELGREAGPATTCSYAHVVSGVPEESMLAADYRIGWPFRCLVGGQSGFVPNGPTGQHTASFRLGGSGPLAA